MVCKECGREYDPKKKKRGGYIWQCDFCVKKDVDRYVGRMGEKCEWMEVFRDNVKYWRAHLRRESAVGFSPNVPVSHPTIEQNKIDKEENTEDFFGLKEIDKGK